MAHLVSVCLPVWNGAKYIESAIASVLVQTHNEIELIVIDDCSSDDTAAIVRRLAAQDKRIRFYQNEFRLGLFENYNKCMSLAKGEYIKPFAQDDLFDSRIIEKLVKLIQSDSNTALACAAREWIDSDGIILKNNYLTIPSVSDIFSTGQLVSRSKVLQCSVFPITNLIGEPAAVLFPRALVASGFDTRYKHLGDLEYWLRLLESGSLVCTSEKLCSIREHSKRQSVENMQSLAIATDYIQFAKGIASSVAAIGYSAESFFRSTIIELSQHLNYTIKDKKQISILENFAKKNPLYEVTFHSLLLIANSKQEIVHPGMERKVELNERHIARMERYLQQLLIAPGWHITRPLRETSRVLNYRFFEGVAAKPSLEFSSDKSSKSLLQNQTSYLHYLRSQIRRVRHSQSWKLIRIFDEVMLYVRRLFGLDSEKKDSALFDRSIYKKTNPRLAPKNIRLNQRQSSLQLLKEVSKTTVQPNRELTGYANSGTGATDPSSQEPASVRNHKIIQDTTPVRLSADYLNSSKHLEKLLGPLKDNYQKLCEIEPLLLELKDASRYTKYEAPDTSAAGAAYLKLSKLLSRPFTHLILLGSTATEKSTNFAFNLCRTTIQNSDDILILYTDEQKKLIKSANNYRSICLNEIGKNLNAKQRVEILVRLVLQSAPDSVLNVGSQIGWNAIRDYHRQLKQYTRLKVCLAGSTQSSVKLDKIELSNLNWCMDFIDELHVTSDEVMNYITNRLSLEQENQWKILVSTFWDIDEQTQKNTARENNYAVADFSPSTVTLEHLLSVQGTSNTGGVR